jgi:hypothetical protein
MISLIFYHPILRSKLALLVLRLGYGLENVRAPTLLGERDFSLLQDVKTGSDAHPAAPLVGTGFLPLP